MGKSRKRKVTNYGTYTKKDVRAAFHLNLVQQIGKSNIAASEDVEDIEDMRESRRTLAQPRQLQLRPPTLLSREHSRRCLRHAERSELDILDIKCFTHCKHDSSHQSG